MDVMWPENMFGRDFCSTVHPDHPGSVYCRRLRGHDGDHAAFVHSIKHPQTWPV